MSTKFTEYKGLNLPNVAEEILNYWKENNIFEKSITTRDDNKPFIFFEGPPSANGLPGIHHAMGRTIKDIFCRYKTLKGFQVKRKAGWDTHGLPVELGVEKELGITKEDIGTKITVEEYNVACKKAVMKYTDIWNNLTEKMGYWVDMEDPYVTYKSKYMETVWWLLKQIYNKDLMYKGYTIQPYSPKAGTGLSSHEVNQPGAYQDVTDTTVVAQFKAVNETLPSFLENRGDIHILAWTTTPWTLPSNTALTVGPKIDYVLVKTFNQYTFEPIQVILGKPLVGKQFAGKKFKAVENEADLATYNAGDKQIPYCVVAECKGADLVGIKYEQLLPYALPHETPEQAFRVIPGDFVTTEDGTGIVHTAPTFGADDALVAKDAGVPPMLVKDANDNLVPLVDLQGKFTRDMGEFAGMYVKNEYYTEGEAPEKSVDVQIAIKLKEENKAFKVEKYVHSYPHCWRTDKPILYYPLDSWFIKVTDVKERMYSLNEEINWKPEATGTGRFGNWLKNANDWNLSRSRFWGIPLPVWRTEDGKEAKIIGSIAELKEEMQRSVEAGVMTEDIFADFVSGDMSEENYDKVDLHKNVVDKITLVSDSGEPMKRESDLIDVWFDSGSMPYAQWHYPFENKELVEEGWKTADFIAEGVDQTRGWFYTLHAIATMVFDDKAYKNVVSNGLVLDKNGQKMSKRLGNGVDPFETLDQYSPDATRWYMISNANPWDNLKFDLDGITEVSRKFFGTLYNTYSFFSLYANIDNFTYSEEEIAIQDRPEIDRWILSELNTLVQKVDKFYAEYEPTKATRAISDFVQDYLSNWYVRLCRRRFWKGEYAQDKISAYQTLYTCMVTVAKLGSPVAPFFMDKLYKDLIKATGTEGFESVHLAEFPKYNADLVDKSLERKMENAQTISSLVLSLRAKEKIKVRQPLQKIMIPVLGETQREEILAVADLIKSEVNVKEIELLDDASGILVKQIKPNFKALGPKFGKDMKLISSEIQKFGQEEIIKIEKEGSISIEINDKIINLETADVEISSKDIEGWLVANAEGLTVALDVTINDDLRKEGVARELINRIQNARKETGLDVTDKIKLTILQAADLENSVIANENYIKAETLTDTLVFVDDLKTGTDIEFDAIKSKMLIEKI
ncbi:MULTISPECIES: isoleucine--tRNA ligase [unclassified Tenacibaculum]|uniref:isoleucine--tRNA ligase n=1 Tax=unclassified Tenacibaculum TaxID=2635139 RepID=UPI001EFFBD95|nr:MULTISPECIES: isoleucine--tRNA ligase [unclassified Tenacibaculum]MCF2874456.1 isoleucine--tRNA ligase [Tenacibaculum sp. Cn5-1]MCF2934478.1 isoleucine--tRNA ligase [Tenacibaculum sp. Cn5-34]MCG7510688.1 isoleucine--tRNA ligase [Tenacibaculum sp. Cn5-46]